MSRAASDTQRSHIRQGSTLTSAHARQPSLRQRHVDNGGPSTHRGDDSASCTSTDSHPLDIDPGLESEYQNDDISRPILRRLTSQTEKQVAESSSASVASPSEASPRGSFDLLRMSPATEDQEVEVLVHHVKQGESLAGIALLYGIDLPTLRKINKLWSSDTVHLRTHLYVPIEACRWNKASETFIRGPGPGQITLVPKHAGSSRKGKAPERTPRPADSARIPSPETNEAIDISNEYAEWGDMSPARTYINGTNMAYDGTSRASLESIRPAEFTTDGPPEQRVVDVVRIPNSQLRFFPKSQSSESRTSLEHDMRRVSLERGMRRSASMRYAAAEDGPSIQNDLKTLPPPLQSKSDRDAPKSNMVKIRPQPSIKTSPSTGSLTDRLTSFFSIPPPPEGDPRFSPIHTSPSSPRHRGSVDSSFSANSRRSSSTPAVLLEMHPRSNKKPIKSNKKTD